MKVPAFQEQSAPHVAALGPAARQWLARAVNAILAATAGMLAVAAPEDLPAGTFVLATDDAQRVNLQANQAPLADILAEIGEQLGIEIKGSAPGNTPPLAELGELAEHPPTPERTSADAEFETQKLKQLEYLWHEAKSAGKGDPATHPALVHDVRRKGLFIELTDYFIKGLVTEADLPYCRGGYWFDGTRMRFVGSKPERIFQAGDTVEVSVARVDFERKLVDFKIVDKSASKKR